MNERATGCAWLLSNNKLNSEARERILEIDPERFMPNALAGDERMNTGMADTMWVSLN